MKESQFHTPSSSSSGSSGKNDDLVLHINLDRNDVHKVPMFYIYINKYNRSDDSYPQYLLDMFDDVRRKLHDKVQVIKHNYNSLLPLVKQHDDELGRYFSLLNPMYATMHANIGRAVLLHRFGGVYHDIKARLASVHVLQEFSHICAQLPYQQQLRRQQQQSEEQRQQNGQQQQHQQQQQQQRREQLRQQQQQQQIGGSYFAVLEVNPEHADRVRLTNMAACRPQSQLLAAYLDGVKLVLRDMVAQRSEKSYNWFGTKVLLDIIEKNSTCWPLPSKPTALTTATARTAATGQRQLQHALQLRHLHSPHAVTECCFRGEFFLSRHFELAAYNTKSIYNRNGATHWSNLTEPLLLLT